MWHKLVTRADRGHGHKVLGIACVLSFAVHYCVHWPRDGALHASLPVIALHVALSTTAIQFDVPRQRIGKWPTMIWEEYRLHAIVFSWRALVVALLDGPARVMGISCVHIAADEVTRRCGRPGHTTVRGEHTRRKSSRVRGMTCAYAVYQHLALASHLVGNNAVDLAYNTLLAVQSSAFCMTLHRKGLITHFTHAKVYLVCISVSGAFIVQSLPLWQTILALLCSYARMQNVDKYPLWLMYWAVCTIGTRYLSSL